MADGLNAWAGDCAWTGLDGEAVVAAVEVASAAEVEGMAGARVAGVCAGKMGAGGAVAAVSRGAEVNGHPRCGVSPWELKGMDCELLGTLG